MRINIARQEIDRCADPARVKAWLARAAESVPGVPWDKLSAAQARLLVALMSGSQAAGELLRAHGDWLPPLLEPGALEHPRQEQGLRREVERWLGPALQRGEIEAALAELRLFKEREMLRIATRDLARLDNVFEITREISNVADVCLQTVFCLCLERLARRHGTPWHLDADEQWQKTRFCVLGLGKLGGQELNYSSDVDVIFVYEEEGQVIKDPPRARDQTIRGLSNHQFFTRLGETMIAEIGKMTAEGMLFRIDLRLRPEGDAGPLVRSLQSYESYYAQWGQTWERMMLIKARPVAGDAVLGAEFLEMIQPFRFPRSLGQRTLREVAAVKTRIENEVVRPGEAERNVKLGRGGIREIEFIAQTLQLLHAGRLPFLQGAATVPTLEKLAKYSLLRADEAAALAEAYVFLRQVEHRLQMEANRQTHTIPAERRDRERLARLMGCATLAQFDEQRLEHCREVRRIFDKLLAGEEPAGPELPPLEGAEAAALWKKLLATRGFRDADSAFGMVKLFILGPGYAHVSTRTMELARELWPRFLALCPWPQTGGGGRERVLSDPDRVLVRLAGYIEAYGARAALYELWTHNPALFELLLLLFDRSEFLAERAVRAPDLVDELESGGRLNRSKSAAEILTDLRHGAGDADQALWLRRYHQAETMRIGLRDILGLADFEANLQELTCLAEACLQYAVEAIMRRHILKRPPFCVLGLGKLGGHEITYGSDLDIVFVARSGAGNLPQCQRWAAELMELLSAKTESGATFATDARLRPDGEKGLLVNTVEAHEDYYRRRAALWEIQALTRVRAIAGDLETGAKYERMAGAVANFSPQNVAARAMPAAYSPDWMREIDQMRQRIAAERTPPGKDHLAIKTGTGGLIDAEFLAQAICLGQAWREPNTLRALRRAREAGVLAKTEGEALLRHYGQLRRVEGILRRWSFEGETVLPDEEAPYLRVAVRCGFRDAKQFSEALRETRTAIRAVYNGFFGRLPTRSGGAKIAHNRGV
ncbi:MAG: bifunctional [glutamate--ammonia ligase]-adenylyl-L-tyrosine phosphorylase/[glutamate--ammonia-ligase] adenylyltransferase [Limisphaerales bacterium]